MRKYIIILFFLTSNVFGESVKDGNKDTSAKVVDSQNYDYKGFYFHILNNLGIGYGYASLKDNGKSSYISFLSNNGSIQFGYGFKKNWIPFISFDYATIPAHLSIISFLLIPNIEVKGTIPDPFPFKESSLILSYSGGIKYYFMPQNIYLSGSIGFAQMSVYNYTDKNNEVYSESNYGISVKTALGKEWWQSVHWGIGIALLLEYDFFPETTSGPQVTPFYAFSFGISFSVTYN